MSAPAGPCEWCGGPQHWTIIRGDMYVSCDGGCIPLPLEGLVPPPGSEGREWPTEEKPYGTFKIGGGSKPCEGAGADDSMRKLKSLGVSLEATLHNLWEGGPVDG